jgi:phosphatidylserine decarboxylase
MVREAYPFVIPALLASFVAGGVYLVAPSLIWAIVCVLAAVLTLFFAYFFRDPERNVPQETGIVISAADGLVTKVEDRETGLFVSVFLSPLDVHINRAPIAGTITKVDYVKGKKGPATTDKSSIENERNSITIEGDGIQVVCTQIAGLVARRIVCWKKEGDVLKAGERFGLIKFSSRTDLVIPKTYSIAVKVGDRVKGGETIIARRG